jgi:hypothetical protein
MIVSDNGTELISNAILSWQQEHDIEWHYIAPGKQMQNGIDYNTNRPQTSLNGLTASTSTPAQDSSASATSVSGPARPPIKPAALGKAPPIRDTTIRLIGSKLSMRNVERIT